ncbi:MAG: class I SAM-dependent methyltransferase [Gammaproteobacteria bacterium]|nr:class I SAM-dependent methyltransferase [Gammaproteobacteria bacterium]
MSGPATDFGFERVTPAEKTARVGQVFSSVAGRYDLMNDLMSLGVHRLWKREAVLLSGVRRGAAVLDVAGGTGDCALLYRAAVGDAGRVAIADINADMLRRGRDRLTDRGVIRGIEYVQADAELLPFRDQEFDCISIAFGLRNVTHKERALRSMLGCLRFGGTLVVLEFSRVVLPMLERLYDAWSLHVIPALGELIAGDRDSYRYLVESIRVHPDQETLRNMMLDAGFGRVDYVNLSGGIVAVHRGRRI